MKFAHLSDCHIGSWREPKMRDLSTSSFIKAMDICKEEGVDFVVIAGDIFNTAVPAIECLRTAVDKFKELKDLNIPIYLIPGSHDFSASGKSMLDVLESAGLCTNVSKGALVDNKLRLSFVVDKKTGVKITGLLGRKCGLEKNFYEVLDRDFLEQESGSKIFVFHTALDELKPKDLSDVDSMALSLLPKGFNYYAGGHVHIVESTSLDGYNNIVYPGPVFPNSFSEIEKLRYGGFYIVEDWKPCHVLLELHPVFSIVVSCDKKSSKEVEEELIKSLNEFQLKNALITIRVFGRLASGRLSDIGFRDIIKKCYDCGAYFVLKNSGQVVSKEFEPVVVERKTVDEIENEVISQHALQQTRFAQDRISAAVKTLMLAFSREKLEGETNSDFEKRLKEEIDKLLS